MEIKASNFGTLNNHKIQLFTLSNSNKVTIKFTNYGGIVTSIETPDKNNKIKNIALGFDTLEEYLSEEYLGSYPYFGAIIGRVANRIAQGKFTIEGEEYSLEKNNDNNHLHGGLIGLDRVIWKATPFEKADEVGVVLSYLSVDGEEGYPGNLKLKVIYSLTADNEFKIEYFAETDATTPINLTQHSYFNLGDDATVKNHKLQLNSEKYTEVNSELIPTGNMPTVDKTTYDFRNLKRIGEGFEELQDGYDTNYDLENLQGNLIKAAELQDPKSGRVLEVFTTEVGIQLYTGGSLPTIAVNGNPKFGKFTGVALETQHFPDAINQPNFESILLYPEEQYHQKTIYKFSVLNGF